MTQIKAKSELGAIRGGYVVREDRPVSDHTQLRHAVGVLTEAEVAAILGKEVSTLQKMRSARIGPPWLKSGQSVLYRRQSLEAWLEAQERRTAGPDPRLEDGYSGEASPRTGGR